MGTFMPEIKHGKEMKNVFNQFISTLEVAKEKYKELKDRPKEIISIKLIINEYGHKKRLLNSLSK